MKEEEASKESVVHNEAHDKTEYVCENDTHLLSFEALKAASVVERDVKDKQEPESTRKDFIHFSKVESETIEYVVDGLIPRGDVSLVVSKPKVGKSTLMRYLAYCVCEGKPFLGRKVCQGNVGYMPLGNEAHLGHARDELRMMGANMESPIFFPKDPFGGFGVEDINLVIERLNLKLLIIDTLARLLNVENMNDYAPVVKAQEPLQLAAKRNDCAVVVLHHSKKGLTEDLGDSSLGSQGIFGSVSSLIGLQNGPDDTRRISSVQRYGDSLEPTILLKRDDCTFELGPPVSHYKEQEAQDAIVRYIMANPGCSTKQIKDNSGTRTELVGRMLNLLTDQEILKRTGTGTKNSPHTYHLTYERRELDEEIGRGQFEEGAQ